jgi:parallel beta-helix repeat protein
VYQDAQETNLATSGPSEEKKNPMLRNNLIRCLSGLAVALACHYALASTTYLVGTCKSGYQSFATISNALKATPAPNTVLVCPGTYPEQVEITIPVTLEGITVDGSAQAIIAPPVDGFVHTAAGVVQLLVNNAAGTVNVSNLTVDAENQVVSGYQTVGVEYSNTPGTMNNLTVRNQNCISSSCGFVIGLGIQVFGGSSNPAVTVENSTLYATGGMDIDTNGSGSQLTITIKGNYINGGGLDTDGIELVEAVTATVTSNTILNNGAYGIAAFSLYAGSISENTMIGNDISIFVDTAIPITSNKIYESESWSIETIGGSEITGNLFVTAPVGIEFACQSNPNVHSNTFNDVVTALDDVPSGTVSTNSYFNVGTIQSSSNCTSDAERTQMVPAQRALFKPANE